METVRIDDVFGYAAEVEVIALTNRTEVVNAVVSIDFDPDDCGATIMQYSPDDARKLAAALILAAEEAEKQ